MRSGVTHSRLALALLFAVSLLGVEAAWLRYKVRAAGRQHRILAGKQEEYRRLLGQCLVPAETAYEILRTELDTGRQVLAGLHVALHNAAAEKLSGRESGALEVFSAMARTVELLRKQADASGVVIDTDEHFGFSGYARTGPGDAQADVVVRQLHAIEYLVGLLLSARPTSLIDVRREQPGGSMHPVDDAGGDYFTLAPGLSVRVQSRVETDAYRFVFAGSTAGLRSFLNSLAQSTMPVVVRAVDVDPADGKEAMQSRFTVTLEVILAVEPAQGEPA